MHWAQLKHSSWQRSIYPPQLHNHAWPRHRQRGLIDWAIES